ncbi:MTQ1 (YNL063W) [Zygosaccharomyces parabailii]|uniref:peptide chain release factor N(5)-glutamine methyltransferase n=1 Tax=Zygosaccharomyces bailii (strain CLIB 213 / ATCC 58445 / CBS 680 / BCRC 21525 / NBRC 1098 / NCYC 1416 / NRRL Y-2227) TaxID=1333698 RepID=A0A8J2T9U6_ZYGB2|nr:MTQ1 (YNL063W) [Zygosaccharomyces parabailii]CDF91171.1 ZYBA0S10-01288g1_1 [Zygosaccharomyces bailii CLIB 213]CDH16945.1 related to MTQ1-Putative Methyltransferase localised to mitochondria [Zygosaccharomyces bailii ISA1307]SJM87997.1 related to Mitochondrial N(5)-glutamine methyltransferase MTQ1 [Zygosaccharomyces bailii]
MPRIPPSTLRQAFRTNRLLPLLLPACRNLEQSIVELRWMQQELDSRHKIRNACLQRSKLVPLQYILGNQPFGELQILCRPGVLIPRWETEEWAYNLAQALLCHVGSLDVWDLCAGTGCIGLLLQSELGERTRISSVDLSGDALSLCKVNAEKNGLHVPRLITADLLNESNKLQKHMGLSDQTHQRLTLITCNPPYIPKKDFVKETALSVRMFEPKLALVGSMEFYENLVDCWLGVADCFVYEVGDQSQIDYVTQRIAADGKLRTVWCVGQRTDSNGRPRVVYGFRYDNVVLKTALGGYGELLHFPEWKNI